MAAKKTARKSARKTATKRTRTAARAATTAETTEPAVCGVECAPLRELSVTCTRKPHAAEPAGENDRDHVHQARVEDSDVFWEGTGLSGFRNKRDAD